jgi:hypothetical protein
LISAEEYHRLHGRNNDTDFVEWIAQTTELLRAGRLDQADLEHVAEEIADWEKASDLPLPLNCIVC